MKVTVLVDNLGCGELPGEWGLSFFIEYEGKNILLDTGASDLFARNAEALGKDLSAVDFAVLSHAHYDHTDGLDTFLNINSKAPVYLSPKAEANCYSGPLFRKKYIGLPKDVIAANPERIVRPEGLTNIDEGVWILPHSTPGLARQGKRNRQYVKKGLRYCPDDFSHEHTLVFETEPGLLLMNSCSHSGPEVIVDEARKAFPGKPVAAFIGGLHLFRLSEAEVAAVADRLEACGLRRLVTGHCTGQPAFDLLKARFGSSLTQFHSGLEIEI